MKNDRSTDREPAASTPVAEGDRGRHATSPRDIPRQGWKDILLRVKDEVGRDNVSIVAAGVAFYTLLAVFPALIAAVSIYGLVSDPADVARQMSEMTEMLPPSARSVVGDQLQAITTSSDQTLGLGLAISILAALWSASKGTSALVTGINIAYDEEETRGFLRQTTLNLGLTAAGIAFGVVAVGLITVVPHLFGTWATSTAGVIAIELGRWVLLLCGVLLAIAVIYRFAPARDKPRWRWVSYGSVAAAVLWLVASMLFSWYSARFASFNETYGSLAGVIVLLLWMQISAFAVLFGAELNSEIEHQTAVDSTEGEPEPMGRRGAVKADTLGESRG